MTLDELAAWVPTVPSLMPEAMQPMAASIVAEMREPIERLPAAGARLPLARSRELDAFPRASASACSSPVPCATARAASCMCSTSRPSACTPPMSRGCWAWWTTFWTTAILWCSWITIVRVLRHADHLIEIGPGSGAAGGRVIAQGSVAEVEANPATRIGPFLTGSRRVRTRERASAGNMFTCGEIRLATDAIHTVETA